MFKKKSLAFTLIELLAVIVILGIIMLIATPLILKMIEEARMGAFRASAYGIIKAAENNYSRKILYENKSEKATFTYDRGIEIPSISNDKLEYKGLKPKSGEVIINEQGQVALAIHNGTYCALKDYKDLYVTVNKNKPEDCKLSTGIINNPQLEEMIEHIKETDSLKIWIDMQEGGSPLEVYGVEEGYVPANTILEIYNRHDPFTSAIRASILGSNPTLIEKDGYRWMNFEVSGGDSPFQGKVMNLGLIPFSPNLKTAFVLFKDKTPLPGSTLRRETTTYGTGDHLDTLIEILRCPGYSSPLGYPYYGGKDDDTFLKGAENSNFFGDIYINGQLRNDNPQRIREKPTVLTVTSLSVSSLGLGSNTNDLDWEETKEEVTEEDRWGNPYTYNIITKIRDNYFFIGEIGEVLFFDATLSPNQIKLVNDYLLLKYDINQ